MPLARVVATDFVSTSRADDSLTLRTSWLVAGKTLAFAFTVAIPVLLVRRMPQHEFGLYKQIFLVINSAVTMLPLGFGMTAFYFLPRDAPHRPHTVFNIVTFTAGVAVMFGALLVVFPTTLVLLFKEPSAVAVVPWIACVVCLWVVGSLLEILTVANEEVRLATAAIAGIQLSRALLFLIAAVVGGTVRAILIAATIHGLVQVGALGAYTMSRFPRFWRSVDRGFLKEQVAYAVPLGVGGLLYSLQLDLHSYFISHEFGASAYAVYAVGAFQLPLFGILADSVAGVLIPRISMFERDRQTREIVCLLARAMRKLALVYFPAYALLMVVRREFIVTLFTARYVNSVPIFAVNLTLIPLGIFLMDPIIRAHAEHRTFPMKLHASLLAGLVVTLPIAIRHYGLLGAITTVVAINVVGRAAGLVKIARVLHVRAADIRLLAGVVRVAGATAIAAILATVAHAAIAGLKPLPTLIVCGAVFAAAYLLAALTLEAVTAEERRMFSEQMSWLGARLAWRQADTVAIVPE